MLPNAIQCGLIIAGLTTTQAPAMEKKVTFTDQMEMAKKSFPSFLDSNESKLKVANWVPNCITNASSKAMGYGDVTAEERTFVNRFFEDKAKKQRIIEDFIKNTGEYQEHIFTIFGKLQTNEAKEPQIDPINLLIDIMHQETLVRLKQNPKTTRVEMAQKVLLKDATEKYIIPDEGYLRVALVNFFSMHMYEQFFRK
jgi:hypothetical protein